MLPADEYAKVYPRLKVLESIEFDDELNELRVKVDPNKPVVVDEDASGAGVVAARSSDV